MWYSSKCVRVGKELWFKVPPEVNVDLDEFDVHKINGGYDLTPVGDEFAINRAFLKLCEESWLEDEESDAVD